MAGGGHLVLDHHIFDQGRGRYVGQSPISNDHPGIYWSYLRHGPGNMPKLHKFIWLKRTILVEGIFLLFFMQWYAARYYRIFGKMPFFTMVGVILGLSLLVIIGGMIKDKVLANRQKSITEEIK